MEVATEQKLKEPQKANNFFLKYLIIGLFIMLPFIGFYLGTHYKEKTAQENNEVLIEKPIEITQPVVEKKESKHDAIERCGDIPPYSQLSIYRTGRFTQLSGPMWSPDCRHIAYAIWESGTSFPDTEYQIKSTTGENDFEGLFLYSDKTGEVEKIYKPNPGETTEFVAWNDRNTIFFKTDGNTEHEYYLPTETITTPSAE